MKKLTSCKTCGAQIAKSASKCPQCGAAKTTVARMIVLVLIALVIGLWLCGRIMVG